MNPRNEGAARPPAAAGRFYPGEPRRLEALVDELLARAPAPEGAAVQAVVAPHAGFDFSGGPAACALRALAAARPSAVVLLGAAHAWDGEGAALAPQPGFATPLGVVPRDERLAERLGKVEGVVESGEAHAREHSWENLLPFLQRALPGVPVVPLVVRCAAAAGAQRLGRALGEACRGTGAAFAVSSDLSHFPSAAAAERADETTLAAFERADPGLFWRVCDLVEAREPSVRTAWCGRPAAAAGLAACAALGARRVRVLRRTHSGETGGDSSRVVGYAAAAIYPGEPGPSSLSSDDGAALLALARSALERLGRKRPAERPGLAARAHLNLPGGAFVTLRERAGDALRGCIGILERPDLTLAEAVAEAAVRSGTADPRFSPVSPGELAGLRVEVSVLSPLEPAAPEALRPGIDGVRLTCAGRQGLLLPQVWERIPEREAFLDTICENKMGLPSGAWRRPGARLERFTAQIFDED